MVFDSSDEACKFSLGIQSQGKTPWMQIQNQEEQNMAGKTWWKGPVEAEPNFENLLKVLKMQKPDRPTLFEFFLNRPLYLRIAGPEAASWVDQKPYGHRSHARPCVPQRRL
jgi:hypothetical protein